MGAKPARAKAHPSPHCARAPGRGGPEGSKAAAIRDYAKDNLQCDFSIKAVGMTLNRLAKEGRARRAGQVWFRVHQGLQTEDVGAIAF